MHNFTVYFSMFTKSDQPKSSYSSLVINLERGLNNKQRRNKLLSNFVGDFCFLIFLDQILEERFEKVRGGCVFLK